MVEIWHKLFLIILKYIPILIGIAYFIASVFSCFGIYLVVLNTIFYMSPITALFILIASATFKFCIWHRLPIYYALLLHGISILDYYTPLTLTNSLILFVYLLITIMFILIGLYLKNKHNKKYATT